MINSLKVNDIYMKKIVGIFLLTLALFLPELAYSDDIDKAYAVCAVFDNTGILSEPCEISGWDGAIDVTMDTNSTEARKICNGASQMLADQELFFNDRKWEIRIYSPFSDGNTLATCNLPTR